MQLKSRRYISFLVAIVALLAATSPAAAKSIRLGNIFKHSVFCIHHHQPDISISDLQKQSLTFVETEDEDDEIEMQTPEKGIYSLLRPAQSRENNLQDERYTTVKQYDDLTQPHLYIRVNTRTLPYYYTFLFRFTPF
ncbi:MAG: hypothetical protein QM731_10970 [Chitinophagaceae bacterium]